MPVITPRLRLRTPRRTGLGKRLSAFAPRGAVQDRLSDLAGVRSNPGKLRARCYVPERLARPAPLVVVLHGCTQDAAVYDHGSGWSALADRLGFALLFPEQQRANNPLLCFNWFEPGDTARGRGEAASIAAMVEAMAAAHDIDRERIFVTGLSAGGAMASAMLAAYPETFAAGAILAGVAFGCADNVGDAFACMAGRGGGGADLAAKVRRASPHQGPWPRVQVWQGSADRTVVPANAESIVRQWAPLHGVGARPDAVDEVDGHARRRWLGAKGEPLIEQITIGGMGHGVPLDTSAEEPLGRAGAHMLDVGLSSTLRIAEFFGIAQAREARGDQGRAKAEAKPRAQSHSAPKPTQASGPQAAIERALRAAGLLR